MNHSLQYIEEVVCNYLKLTNLELHAVSRKRKAKEARQKIMTLALELKYTQKQAAEYFGSVPATALSARKRIYGLCESDKMLDREMDLYRSKLNINNSRQTCIDKLKDYRAQIDGMIDFLEKELL